MIFDNKQVYENKRDYTFDFLKMYAMLSVVLDHCLQAWIGGDIQKTQLYNFIFLSQMPIFMFTSGYFTIRGLKPKTTSEVISRVLRIIANMMIPFVTFAVIKGILHGNLILHECFLNPDNSLWFLWALMWMKLFMIAAQQLSCICCKNVKMRVLLSVVFYMFGLVPVALLYRIHPDLFATKLILFYSAFYLLGYVYAELQRSCGLFTKKAFRIISIPILMLAVAVVMRKHPCIIFENESPLNLIWRCAGSTCAVFMMYYIASYVVGTKLGAFISRLGAFSLEMYYMHMLFLSVDLVRQPAAGIIDFIVRYLIMVSVSMGVILLIKCSKIADAVIFGKIGSKLSKEK